MLWKSSLEGKNSGTISYTTTLVHLSLPHISHRDFHVFMIPCYIEDRGQLLSTLFSIGASEFLVWSPFFVENLVPPCRAGVILQQYTVVLYIGWIERRLVQSPCSSLRIFCFCGGRRKRLRCYVRRALSSMQRKTAKEAWRPKCAAPRLVYDSALFFETFYARTSIRTCYVPPNIFGEKKRKTPGRQVSG